MYYMMFMSYQKFLKFSVTSSLTFTDWERGVQAMMLLSIVVSLVGIAYTIIILFTVKEKNTKHLRKAALRVLISSKLRHH